MKKTFPVFVLVVLSVMAYSQTQRLVLFEECTGENCLPCAVQNPYVQSLINTYPSSVLWLRYQCNIPSAGSLYNQDKTDVDSRLAYYAISSAPWAQQDGAMWDSSLLAGWGNQPITWCADTTTKVLKPNYLLAESAVTSPFSMAVSYRLSTAADSFYATVAITGAQSYIVSQPGKLKLRACLIENIQFVYTPGANGETHFPGVVRKMYPGEDGIALPDSSYTGLLQTFSFSGKLPGYVYDKSQLRFAAFIQDDNTKHVQQAAVSIYDTLEFDIKAQVFQNSYLTCDTPFQSTLNFTNNGTRTLTSALATIIFDGAYYSNINWTGNLAPGNNGTLVIPAINAATGQAHTLKAIISNPNGNADLNPGNDTILLDFAVTSAPTGLPLLQGFEAASAPDWFVQNPSHSPHTWLRDSVGDNSSGSYYMDFYETSYGVINNLYAPTLNFSGVANPKLTFSHANAQFNFGAGNGGLSQDSLYILVSTNCGLTWNTVYAKGGNSLATVGPDSDPYLNPGRADWVNDTVDLSAVANANSVIIQFSTVSGNGNDLYLDNVNILNPEAVGIKSLSSITSLWLFPNPATDLLNVRLEMAQQAKVFFTVTNTLGQVVITGPGEIESAGINSLTINTAKLAPGVYFLSLLNGAEKTSSMFAVVH